MAELSQGVSRVGGSIGYHFAPLYVDNTGKPSELTRKAECDFYKGCPPHWLNFQDAGSPLVKRNGYKDVIREIKKAKRSCSSIMIVSLSHEPGSGGSTLAMQVLWDLRKEFKCAVVKDGAESSENVAQQVIALFSDDRHKTVLLLMDNLHDMNALQKSLIQQIASKSIDTQTAVVVILKCVRVATVKNESCVHLKTELSEEEKRQFEEKQAQICERYGEEQCRNFHGFNIMQYNFSGEYVNRVVPSVSDLRSESDKNPENINLLSILALLNSYIPGSSLKKTDCLKYLGHSEPTCAESALETEMQPFTNLLVTVPGEGENREEDSVRMCHPLIAKRCIELFESVGWKKSCITEKFLTYADEVELRDNALQTILTKREKTERKKKSEKEKFSRLVLDIKNEGKDKCTKILEQGLNTFKYNAFLPQALARFYYIEMSDFKMAEKFAQEAMKRKPDSSFIADTLGRVHKTNMTKTYNPSEILPLAEKAIDAFEREDRLAEIEASQADENIFNHRGKSGCVQVANFVSKQQSRALSESIKGEVKKKCAFFETYLTYSKSSIEEDDPMELCDDVTKFIQKYARQNSGLCTEFQKLKQEGAASFPGILHCLDKKPDLHKVTSQWKKVFELNETSTNTQNYILANIALSCKEPTSQLLLSPLKMKNMLRHLFNNEKLEKTPELYLLVLLLFWPESEDGYTSQEKDHRGTDKGTDEEVSLVETSVQQMRESYEQTYSKYLRSRYLVPLFFLGKGDGLSRLVHRSKIDDCLVQSASFDLNQQWSSGEVWNNSKVYGLLRRVNGVAQQRKVYVSCAGKQIEVHPHKLASVRYQGDLSFYLGFNIKGPVAYDIKYN